MESTLVALLAQYLGGGGVLIAVGIVAYRFFLRKYEARTNQVIQAYKEELEVARQQIEAASTERKEITVQFLRTMVALVGDKPLPEMPRSKGS